MTEAQEAAFDYIDNAVYDGATKISWSQIRDAVCMGSVGYPKNWMSIRAVLDTYMDDGSLVRTADLTVEEYNVDLYEMMRRS